DKFGFVLVVAKTDEENLPSRLLCERIGMTLVSTSGGDDDRAVRECVYQVDRQNLTRRESVNEN
ncbi:hypothetical protein JF66_21745, partial [Cryobacterium sp. MLB-32]